MRSQEHLRHLDQTRLNGWLVLEDVQRGSGDDTIFVATKTVAGQKQLLNKLRSLQH